MSASAAQMVRIQDAVTGHVETCALDKFLEANRSSETFNDAGDEELFAAGARVIIGGGAQPLVFVQLVRS